MIKKIRPLPMLLGLIFTTAGLSYLFWGMDIVPDNVMPIVGYLDDAFVMIGLWILFKKAQKKLK
jgi:uncharacterized membrane protein YkvA (DUF1232 family)